VFHDQNAAAAVDPGAGLSKSLPQIHHRDDLSAQVDDPSRESGASGTAVISGTRTISWSAVMGTP